MRPQLYETSFLGMGIMAGPDLQAFLHATTLARRRSPTPAWRVGLPRLSTWSPTGSGMQLVNGPALVARLVKSADDLGVRLWTTCPRRSC